MCIIPYTVVLLLKDGVYHLLELSAPSSGSIKMIDQVATLFITDLLTHLFFLHRICILCYNPFCYNNGHVQACWADEDERKRCIQRKIWAW